MPYVPVAALFLTAVTAVLYHEIRGGRVTLVIAVGAALVAAGTAYAAVLLQAVL